ncbi:GNAT family N-acetyltransferase [Gordonia sp. (in: high G+C Gram-positive bacteria)]|uniref:GNAT family N-acetyltransferase n=1 Tax=Gordonia sp. (in: high G+C Gram-positive bacteria) TaxID=84139 RepID=UPI0025BD91F1|nr:GNAT family N-acetyltransferase [Gordonia sp. (in: high G+C Gram-positive bacteria)]
MRLKDAIRPTIRLAIADDLPVLQAIEIAAGAAFADLGMDLVAGDEPATIATLLGYVADGRAWVAIDAESRPCGYLLAEIVDDCAHIEQVSVHPDFRGRRIGRDLIDHCENWARAAGLPAMTLTTYRDVAWNGPYYELLGFAYLADATPGLREIRRREAAAGLDAWPRACMRRAISSAR